MNNSLTEPPFVPAWARKLRETIFFIYNGSSMTPFFKPGDLLCAQETVMENVHLGDIIIIHWEDIINHPEYVVHRIVSVKPEFLLTQGDNNLKPDLQIVTKENLIGLVTFFGRKGRVYSVGSGMMGLFYARIILTRNILWLLVKRLGWRIYRPIRQSGLIARVWRPAISQIRVMTDNGHLIKYCYGNRTVARWWPETKKFDVVKPFDLVISNPEESKLNVLLD